MSNKQTPAPQDQQVKAVHEDDEAVNRFADVMKAKLSKKRTDGRGGWRGSACSEETLSRMLREHVEKGDPIDVANFAMMLHQRGERIAHPAPQAEAAPSRDEALRAALRMPMPEDFISTWHAVTEWCAQNDETVEAQTAWGEVTARIRADLEDRT